MGINTTTLVKLHHYAFKTPQLYLNSNNEVFVFTSSNMLVSARTLPTSLQYSIIFRSVPAAAPAEYRRCRIPYSLDCTLMADDTHPIPHDAFNILTEFTTYTPAPPGMRAIYQVHPVYVAKLSPERISTLWQLFQNNTHMVNYEHAALFLWWVLLPEHLYTYFLSTNLHKVDLLTHGAQLSEILEVCRQQASCCGCTIGEEAFLWIRKYKNLFGRRKGQCDVDLERARYHPAYCMRKISQLGNYPSRKTYLHTFWRHVLKITDAVISNMNAIKIDSLQEWWTKRVNTIASGSSSNRHMLDQYIVQDSRITNSDRPNKKAVSEVYHSTYIYELLRKQPIMIARRSTKNEPGLKQRALYAVDDDAVIISAFASMGVEKMMNIFGMCPQQKPSDVLQWWKDGKERRATEVWLSADYTDFNKEHSSIELELLNLAFAYSWIRKCKDPSIAREKTFCSLWVAEAQRHRFVKTEEGKLERVFSALFSGSRDTARDNTLLHQVYHNIIVEWLDENIPHWGRVKKAHMCGDDEDVLFSDPLAAALYYHTIKHIGWHTNDSKQMCGYTCHEFLQKFPHEEKGCIAPIASMISALCSGQWYTTPGMQQDCAVSAISDQMWELIVRGGDPKRIYLLTVDVLNDYMQVKDKDYSLDRELVLNNTAEQGIRTNSSVTQTQVGRDTISTKLPCKKKLEWWQFRMGQNTMPTAYLEKANIIPNNTTFLWLATVNANNSQDCIQPPKPFFYTQYCPTMPHNASQAWCNRWYKLFERYNCQNKFPNYVLSIKANSYGSLYHTYWQKLKKRWLWDNWPERVTVTTHATSYVLAVDQFVKECKSALSKDHAEIFSILTKDGVSAEQPTLEQQLAKVGADPIMFALLGGKNNKDLVTELKITNRAKERGMSWIDCKKHLFKAHMLLDPALRSFLTNTGPA